MTSFGCSALVRAGWAKARTAGSISPDEMIEINAIKKAQLVNLPDARFTRVPAWSTDV
ncbi:MAG TPA: hypothetical protein VFP38_24185 [Bradyrhizobium sp.]|nr:hypothetical protein [Bradyrhizobium sp.]